MKAAYTPDNLRELFQSTFDLKRWYDLLKNFLGATELRTTPERIEQITSDEGCYLGSVNTTDHYRIGLFYYKIAEGSVVNKRVGLRNLVKSFINPTWGEFDAALVVFDSEDHWRLSFICDIKGEVTSPKRYTYVFGQKDNHYHTAVPSFMGLQSQRVTFSSIKKAFSVEPLTKQFYKDLFGWYLWAIDPASNITYPNNTAIEEDDREDIETKIIRMITRLMFVWFIKQKNLVPDQLFDPAFLQTILKEFDPDSTTTGNYYNAILQNLFFGTLNRAILDNNGNTRKFATSNKRDVKNLYRYAEMFAISEQEVIQLFSEVPFLNGGLFECLDKTRYSDGVEQCYNYDGFSRNALRFSDGRYKHRAVVPNILFFEPDKGLFSILRRYNFTIEENSPEEQEVALDPELLGKVFENLLGAYNPETKETARNQSGSFYTPREVVNYMVDESLIAYLGNTPEVRQLFRSDFEYAPHQSDFYLQVTERLKQVKILDPACGSGAFPMGLLSRIVEVLQRIAPTQNAYELKLYLIENCLYGSDIQSIAAQITKLRFFISLICECKKDASKPNFGIPTLPNLETKFVSADSLIAKKKMPIERGLFDNQEINQVKEDLIDVRHHHFSACSTSTKHRLREKDQELRKKLAKLLSEDEYFAPEDALQLAAWNPYDQNAVSPFFDPEWMFGVADGFDIVIGNPPYISTKGVATESKEKYKEEFGFSDDTYNLFTFKGISLLKQGGSLSYIIPKTFWTTQTKRSMRDLILSNQINYIFDTANPFDAVMVDTCIIQVIKQKISKGHKISFLDGTKDLSNPVIFDPIPQDVFLNTQNTVIFKPTTLNLKIYDLYGEKVKKLYDKWWSKIETSKKIAQNKVELEAYRSSLQPGDIALLGCLTEGGQGLATANNGKYVAVRRSTKWAKNIIASRPKKLAEAIKKRKIRIPNMEGFSSTKDFLDSLTEHEIANLFDTLKEQYGRDIFGQGYIYKIIDDAELADVNTLTDDEKENGISTSKNYYVPYDKGDKDGNRWYLETPFAIAWSKENVHFLKTDPKARYQGYTFYFREGFCWIDVNSTYLKARVKSNGVFDVLSMSLFTMTQIPDWYFVSLINAEFLSLYVDNFINNTSHFQINDARQLPIIIPEHETLRRIQKISEESIAIKKACYSSELTNEDTEEKLSKLQKELDNLVFKLYQI